MAVIVRFPPSPTGHFHIGSARTALFNYLFAKQQNGTFLLRFEDTDTKRSKKEYEEDILDALEWLNIKPDNTPTRQSERTAAYKTYLQKLIASGHAYEAEDSKEGKGEVIRFKNPGVEVVFNDIIRGDVQTDTADLGDFVIARAADEPLYHLTVVVDDGEAGVTHVIRGEDHISNTARQILLLEALGFKRPTYAHIPLILAPDKSKMSKRHGAVSVNEYRAQGYLPDAMVNYLALLGWHPQDDQEIFTIQELIEKFDLSNVQKGGAVFDIDKLHWMNKHYLGKLNDDAFFAYAAPVFPKKYQTNTLKKLIPLLRERVATRQELKDLISKGEFTYFFDTPIYETGELCWKEASQEKTAAHLQHIHNTLEKIQNNDFNEESIKAALWKYATEKGRGEVLWPMRYALSGREKSPNPFQLAAILGKDETSARLKTAIEKLS